MSTAEKMQTTSVADYIVQRIADEGVAHCFGVAGDYLFPMCNAVERSPEVKLVGCANELNAACPYRKRVSKSVGTETQAWLPSNPRVAPSPSISTFFRSSILAMPWLRRERRLRVAPVI
jgi:hypothetical protein